MVENVSKSLNKAYKNESFFKKIKLLKNYTIALKIFLS